MEEKERKTPSKPALAGPVKYMREKKRVNMGEKKYDNMGETQPQSQRKKKPTKQPLIFFSLVSGNIWKFQGLFIQSNVFNHFGP